MQRRMWLIGGSKTKIRPVKGGRVAERHCEDCRKRVSFRECDVTDKLHAYFIELWETSQRRMVCVECGEDYDVDEFFASLRPRSAEAPRAALPSPPSRPALPKADDPDIDEMLAALKRKLNKA